MRKLSIFFGFVFLTSTLVLPNLSLAQNDDEEGEVPAGEAALYQDSGAFEFENGRDATSIPFELNSDKIYLKVMLNGQGPFNMILDTGSPGMVLDNRTVEKLGLGTGESANTVGAGEGSFPISPVETPVDAELPGLKLLGQTAAMGPLDDIVGPFEGRHLEGLLGCYNIMTQFVVEIDYAKSLLHIRPTDDVPPEGGHVIPLNTEFGHPVATGTLTPLEGEAIDCQFLVDTGMRGCLLLTTPFVNENKLLERSGTTVYKTTGGGIGGQVFSHVGRMKELTFGDAAVDGIFASLTQVEDGLLATDFLSGIIGSGILQRYRVVFDYTRKRLILYDREFDADFVDMDKSGLFLVSGVEDRSHIEVLDVVETSVAGAAGIQVGDKILAVNGKSAGELGLEAIRRMFRQPEGSELELKLERDGKAYSSSLKLAKVI